MTRQKHLEKLMSKLSVSVEDYRDYIAKRQSTSNRLRDVVKNVYSLVKDHQEIPENAFKIDVKLSNIHNDDIEATIEEYFKDSFGRINKLTIEALLHFNDVKEIVYTYGTTFSYIREYYTGKCYKCYTACYLSEKMKAAKLWPSLADIKILENYLKENAPQI